MYSVYYYLKEQLQYRSGAVGVAEAKPLLASYSIEQRVAEQLQYCSGAAGVAAAKQSC